MRRIRVTWSAMPPRIVTAPPDNPVPAPRGTTGMLCLAAIFITAETCSVVEARTTASGMAPSMEPSRSKMRRSLGETMTASSPATRRNSSATDLGSILEDLETAGRRTRKAWRLRRGRADDEPVEPGTAFLVRGHAVGALEDRLLDAAVWRDLDRVPDREAVRGHGVVRLVDLAVDRKAKRFRLRGGAQAGGLALD